MSREEILQERLDRVAAIIDVIEQHGDLDATILAQLRQALSWVPGSLPDESQVYGPNAESIPNSLKLPEKTEGE